MCAYVSIGRLVVPETEVEEVVVVAEVAAQSETRHKTQRNIYHSSGIKVVENGDFKQATNNAIGCNCL